MITCINFKYTNPTLNLVWIDARRPQDDCQLPLSTEDGARGSIRAAQYEYFTTTQLTALETMDRQDRKDKSKKDPKGAKQLIGNTSKQYSPSGLLKTLMAQQNKENAQNQMDERLSVSS